MRVQVFAFDAEGHLQARPAESLDGPWHRGDEVLWIDVETEQPADLKPLLAPLHLSPRILEACLSQDWSTRVDVSDAGVYIQMPVYPEGDRLETRKLAVLCLESALITVHPHPLGFLTLAQTRLQKDTHLSGASPGKVLYGLLDRSFNENLTLLMLARAKVDTIALRFDEDATAVHVDWLLDIGRRISGLSNTLQDQFYCLRTLDTAANLIMTDQGFAYTGALLQQIEYALNSLELLRGRVRDLRSNLQVALQEGTERRLRILTVVSVVFLPLTLIVGIYGMNFTHMPILQKPWSYPLILALMGVIVVSSFVYFWRKGWLR